MAASTTHQSNTSWARFWAVDLHTHTPASRDVNVDTYGASTPEEIVEAALMAGLDAIAITDHNTTTWCDDVAAAAKGKPLIILPGVEISTTEGHLLAIWEEGTPASTINETLVILGISGEDQGKLDIAARVGFSEASAKITGAHGLAIAAHVDRPRGLLELTVAAHVKRTLLDENLAAVEIVDPVCVKTIDAKISEKRTLACVRGSDVMVPGRNVHVLSGIGNRRTWIKAAQPDLLGLKHALDDPDLRVRLEEPVAPIGHPFIESITLTGGFLDRTSIPLSPDLNCLLGGTGTGKSLVIEAIRYAVDQQLDGSAFPAIWKEVKSRLEFAMGTAGLVRLIVNVGAQRFAIERAFDANLTAAASVSRDVEGDWVPIDESPDTVFPISAFSQGEVLEYAREPVGRMSLIDAGVDFGDLTQRGSQTIRQLRENAKLLLEQRARVSTMQVSAASIADLEQRVKELSAFFDKEVVKQQEDWKAEGAIITKVIDDLPDGSALDLKIAVGTVKGKLDSNADVFSEISQIRDDLKHAIDENLALMRTTLTAADIKLVAAKRRWQARFETFKAALDAELSKMSDGASLAALRAQLERLQGQLVDAKNKTKQLVEVERPRLDELMKQRDGLLEHLAYVREQRRQLRRDRAAVLNRKTAKIVKLDISQHPDSSLFRSSLDKLKVGSRVRDEVLDAIGSRIHPFRFVRALLDGNTADLVDSALGIDAASIARLFANIDERGLWSELLAAQIAEMPDRLDMKFRRPDDDQYVSIEQLAHGQKCTAVLVVLLADGDAPVVVDQPEDALHAPWIEEYLVDRLRALRGDRQYIFATRSPGIVVGADAEQIITMRATAGRGHIEATGSLERHDLNKLALHHLEGGAKAFRRRSDKLEPSVKAG
jgi:predicted ATPase